MLLKIKIQNYLITNQKSDVISSKLFNRLQFSIFQMLKTAVSTLLR